VTATGRRQAIATELTSAARVARDARIITLLTLVSRVTGMVRIFAVFAVLGGRVLGDLYETINTVPNVLFELLAGGALQAALVPTFVQIRRDRGEEALDRSSSAVAGMLGIYLAALAVAAMVLAPLIVWLLTAAEPSATVAHDKRTLGTWMLLMFAPQVIWYGLGLVASAVLAARRRFVAAALAPTVNNLVVIAGYVAFGLLRGDKAPDLALTVPEFLALAGGTTLGVVAMTAVPMIALRRAGSDWRPRIDSADTTTRSLRRLGGWAMVQVAGTLALQVGMLVVGNGAVGGVSLFTYGLVFFMLPAALIALPVATAAAPRIADRFQRQEGGEVTRLLDAAMRLVTVGQVMAAAGLAALAWPIARSMTFGELRHVGAAPVASTLLAFAPGVIGYGLVMFFTRSLFSVGQVRGAAIDTAVMAVVGVAAMVVVSAEVAADRRAAALAAAFSAANLLGAVLLGMRLHRRTGVLPARFLGRLFGGSLVMGAAGTAVMSLIVGALPTGRYASLGAILIAGAVGTGVMVALQPLATGVGVRRLLRWESG
jgi:putative peptidoglycan lipid II flippase